MKRKLIKIMALSVSVIVFLALATSCKAQSMGSEQLMPTTTTTEGKNPIESLTPEEARIYNALINSINEFSDPRDVRVLEIRKWSDGNYLTKYEPYVCLRLTGDYEYGDVYENRFYLGLETEEEFASTYMSETYDSYKDFVETYRLLGGVNPTFGYLNPYTDSVWDKSKPFNGSDETVSHINMALKHYCESLGI